MVKNPSATVGDVGSIPGSARFPGGRHGNPLQYSFFLNYFFKFFYFLVFIFLILKSLILTRVPKQEPPSHLPSHNISLGHPHAPAPSMLHPVSDIDWRFNSYMIVYMLECHSPKSSHPLPLPLSPKVRYTHSFDFF